MQDRQLKQLKVVGIFFLAIGLVSAAFFFLFRQEPSCNDGRKNQGETKIDCGGPCFPCQEEPVLRDLDVVSATAVYDTNSRYDLVIKLKNPNELYGAGRFSYQAILFGKDDQILNQTSLQTGFILPAEEKYVLFTGVESPSQPERVKVEISQQQWEKFTDYEEPDLLINNKSYQILSGGAVGYSQANGTLVNNSPYDFETILIKVILKDETGKIVAVNSQTMNAVRSKEHRDFHLVFSHSFAGQVADIEVQPEVNVFNSQNYIRIKGQPDLWDEAQ